MFKKIASIFLAAMMAVSAAAITASAAESEAVAAADDSSVGAADDSSVGADADSSTGAGNKVYFQVDTNLWKNFKVVTFYLYEHESGNEIITWGSKKGNMTDEGNNIWSYDLDARGITLDSNKQYGCIFTGDWSVQTCDLIIGTPCIGDTAYCTGDQVENNVDSNKKSYYVKWKNADSSKYAPPLCITSIGNVVGEALWAGTTKYSLFLNFLKSDGEDGLANALKYNGKSEQQTIDDTAKAMGLGQDDVEKAVKEATDAGRKIDWKKADSTAEAGSKVDSGSASNGGGSSNNGSNGGSSSKSSSSSSSSKSSGTGSVSSGEGTTIVMLFGGVMLAAAGIIFLARKKREE